VACNYGSCRAGAELQDGVARYVGQLPVFGLVLFGDRSHVAGAPHEFCLTREMTVDVVHQVVEQIANRLGAARRRLQVVHELVDVALLVTSSVAIEASQWRSFTAPDDTAGAGR
jgi:hypothetical protein